MPGKRIIPLRHVEHADGQGSRLYEGVCRTDAEGIVAKWKRQVPLQRTDHVMAQGAEAGLRPDDRQASC
jgi:hypothetical protein